MIFNLLLVFFLIFFFSFLFSQIFTDKNPVISLFLFLCLLFFLFFFLYLLGFEYVSLIFLIIYLGAICVVFLCTIMLLDLRFLINKEIDVIKKIGDLIYLKKNNIVFFFVCFFFFFVCFFFFFVCFFFFFNLKNNVILDTIQIKNNSFIELNFLGTEEEQYNNFGKVFFIDLFNIGIFLIRFNYFLIIFCSILLYISIVIVLSLMSVFLRKKKGAFLQNSVHQALYFLKRK